MKKQQQKKGEIGKEMKSPRSQKSKRKKIQKGDLKGLKGIGLQREGSKKERFGRERRRESAVNAMVGFAIFSIFLRYL